MSSPSDAICRSGGASAGGSCPRCECLPSGQPVAGELYCWFPAPHVAGKTAAVFRRFGIRPSSTVADGLAFHFPADRREGLAEALERSLS